MCCWSAYVHAVEMIWSRNSCSDTPLATALDRHVVQLRPHMMNIECMTTSLYVETPPHSR